LEIVLNSRAFVFPGQGSQAVGMGQDIFQASDLVRSLYGQAATILGFDLAQLCFNGPEEELKLTRNTQPALYVHSVALYQLLKDKGVTAAATAGHSLGEFSALAAAGAFSFAQGLQLVKLRGELMHEAGQVQPGTMAAILGLEFDQITAICEQASQEALVVPANFNSPGQVVISGTVAGVKSAMALATAQGAKRALELNVSGAFHSPLMAAAREKFAQALSQAEIVAPAIPVYTNVTATPTTDPGVIRRLLEEQLVSPVQWARTVQNMMQDGIAEFMEIGNGSVLSGLIRKINRQAKVTNVDSMASLAAI
jgi:[acyl-carrier-protein] S-malonyltransferase